MCHRTGTVEMPFRTSQEDGTLEGILQHRELLTKVLDALCGTRGPKDADDSVRQALAEAVLMLVSCCSGAHASRLAGGQSLPCMSTSCWHHKVG